MKKILLIFLALLLYGCKEKQIWQDPKEYSNDIAYAIKIYQQEGHPIKEILSYYETYGDDHPTKTLLYGKHSVYFVGKDRILDILDLNENEIIDLDYQKYEWIVNGNDLDQNRFAFLIKTKSAEYEKLYIVDANTLECKEHILGKANVLNEEYARNMVLSYQPDSVISSVQLINQDAFLVGYKIGQHNTISIVTLNSHQYSLYPNEQEYTGIKQNLIIEEIDEIPTHYIIKDANYQIYFKIDDHYQIRELGGDLEL